MEFPSVQNKENSVSISQQDKYSTSGYDAKRPKAHTGAHLTEGCKDFKPH
jgi:hypothetical protein